MSEEKSIPVGRLGRLARMARVGTRTGATMLLSRSADGAAAQAAAVLGTLRGLAAKVGQTASYVDGLIPEPYREAYESALSTLRAQAPTSSPSAIRAVVEAELGGPIDRLFVEWQDTPIASASIGQVHRARLHDGREVAVKVQHPGIDRAIEADLNNADVVRGLFSTLGPKGLNSKKVFSEVAARFREELDYQQEARHQKFFATLHAGDAKIHIPTVVDSHTSRRVLTTELCSGALLDQAARATEAMRRSYAEVLWRFVFKGILVGGQFNADPHPGNYLFRPDGSVTFLDFGCVQPLTDKQVHQARCIHKAALERDEVAFARHCAALLETRGGNYERLVL
ncbi:MAG TPA: AarF/ABC1/UbiB kinase family protein, partial [Polyangiaceae bacterium]